MNNKRKILINDKFNQLNDEEINLETLSMKLDIKKIFEKKLNKTVNIYLRKDTLYSGIIKGIDDHNNILLHKCVEIIDKSSINIGDCVLNGGCIAYIEI